VAVTPGALARTRRSSVQSRPTGMEFGGRGPCHVPKGEACPALRDRGATAPCHAGVTQPRQCGRGPQRSSTWTARRPAVRALSTSSSASNRGCSADAASAGTCMASSGTSADSPGSDSPEPPLNPARDRLIIGNDRLAADSKARLGGVPSRRASLPPPEAHVQLPHRTCVIAPLAGRNDLPRRRWHGLGCKLPR
jgi:hypothetical protein